MSSRGPFAMGEFMILPPPELLGLIDEFGKVVGHKINTQKSVAFLYIDNELSEKLRKQSH